MKGSISHSICKMKNFSLTFLLFFVLFDFCLTLEKNKWELKNTFERKHIYYTQGLFFDGEHLYESGGLYYESVLVKYKWPEQDEVKHASLDNSDFGEGIAICGEYIYQLTWRERKVLKYPKKNLDNSEVVAMPGELREGWGLTSYTDNKMLASDGSNKIYVLSCSGNGLNVERTYYIKRNDYPLLKINELCYANGTLYANVYFDQNIYEIDLENEKVVGTYDMSYLVQNEINTWKLTPQRLESGDVLNGIAYIEKSGTFLVTGKKWGHYYEVKFLKSSK